MMVLEINGKIVPMISVEDEDEVTGSEDEAANIHLVMQNEVFLNSSRHDHIWLVFPSHPCTAMGVYPGM